MIKNQFSKYHTPQTSMSECGVACLISIFKYQGVEVDKGLVKKLTGLSNTGTSLLGLSEASIELGLKAVGYKGSIEELKKIRTPTLLHVVINGNILHFVVCYGYQKDGFVIGDPASGSKIVDEEQLDAIWKSKRLLLFEGGVNLVQFNSIVKRQRTDRKLRILDLIEEDWGIFVISIFLGLIISVLGLSLPLFTKILLNDLTAKSDDFLRLTGAIGVLFLTLLFRNIIVYIREYLFLSQSKNFNKRTSILFYKKILNLSMSFLDSLKTGDMIARMNDTFKIQGFISYVFGSLVIDMFVVMTATAFIFVLAPSLGIVFSAFIVLFLLISFYLTKKVSQLQRITLESYSVMESTYVDSLSGVEIVKLHNKEDLFGDLVYTVNESLNENFYRLGRLKNRLGLFYSTSGSILVIITIFIASESYFSGILDIGGIIALIQISILVIPPTINISLANFKLQEARVAFDRINELSQTDSDYSKADDKNRIMIDNFVSMKVRGLTFKFPGTIKLIENVRFEINKGDFVVLIGKSGSGKSTLLRVLQKFYEVPDNAVFVNGMEWNAISTLSWRSKIGVVPQEIKIFNSSIAANIVLDENINLLDIEFFLKSIGMDELFNKFPDGLRTIVGEAGINLSGGQKQLVGLVRALYKEPELLMLDEATSFLDKETEVFVFELLKEIGNKKGTATLFVTHNPELVKVASKSIFIS